MTLRARGARADYAEVLATLDCGAWVRMVAFSPDGERLAHGGGEGGGGKVTLRARGDRGDYAEVLVAWVSGAWVYTVAFSPDGGRLAHGGADGKLTLRKVAALCPDQADPRRGGPRASGAARAFRDVEAALGEEEPAADSLGEAAPGRMPLTPAPPPQTLGRGGRAAAEPAAKEAAPVAAAAEEATLEAAPAAPPDEPRPADAPAPAAPGESSPLPDFLGKLKARSKVLEALEDDSPTLEALSAEQRQRIQNLQTTDTLEGPAAAAPVGACSICC